jgi:precorrin-2/cobalt-factor-2 C20-methyltransferase
MSAGVLHGVGVGPGDPELITLKGLRLLQRVDLVFVPATAPGRSFAATIAAPHLDASRQQIVELVCPPYRNREALLARWAELATDVAAQMAEGRDAVFLTEGDPALYSTFQYLAAALRRDAPRVRIETVPGVTSATAAAAVAGLPLAMWNERVVLLPATAGDDVVAGAIAEFDTAVVLKPGAFLAQSEGLASERNVVLVRRAGRPEQAILWGAEALHAAADDYFSLLIVRRRR